ncbi:GntR family transcriptional regulator [Paenibacillus solisilvae]|uniref:GntR family transcriptional regulator n=1 Tax=Paenibacillus solisilvae TaxID=2486751 RepID=A0ABW0W1A7_9BACL
MPLYTQIRSYIEDHIRTGRWREGHRLPSETHLARQFEVSRITVKNAMSKLVEEGIIYRIQGRGTFVAMNEGGEPLRYKKGASSAGMIAFLIPRLDNRFTMNLLRGIERTLSEANIRILYLSTHDDDQREEQLLQEAIDTGVKGIIIYPVDGETYNETILRLTMDRFPIVVIDRYLKGIDTNCVCSDHRGGAYQATEHLLISGHRHIVFITSLFKGTTSLEERLEGYKQALAEYQVPFRRQYVVESTDSMSFRHLLLEHPEVTAAFAANEGIGQKVIEAAESIGRQIPNNLSVVFFDDYERSEAARIPPTCVLQQEEEIGRQAAQLLLTLIENPQQPRRSLRVPTQLMVRHSTGRALLERRSTKLPSN